MERNGYSMSFRKASLDETSKISGSVFALMLFLALTAFGQTPADKYFFTETTGTTCRDSAGTMNGTITGSGVTHVSGGKVGYGLQFNGVNSNYVTITGGTKITTDWTMSCWVYRLANTANSVLIGGAGGTADTCIKLEQTASTYKVGITKGATNSVFSSNYIAPLNTWVHLVLVKNSTNITLYVNGASSGTTTTLIDLKRGVIGANYAYQNVLNAKIDELNIYTSALTAAQVLTLYQSYATLTTAVSGSGTVTPSSPITVRQGATNAITATPNSGNTFVNWTVTSGTATVAAPTSASTTVTVNSTTATVQANFGVGHQPPTDAWLTPSSINENQPANSLVGTFSATDPDPGSTFTFSLVSGTGDADNGRFGIVSNNQLVTTQPFDFETKNSYSIRVRINDNYGLPLEKQFTVTVTDVSEYANPTITPTPEAELTGTAETISWTPVVGAYSYDLDIGSTSGGNNLYNGTTGTATTVNVTGLPSNGSTIYVRLTTTDVGGTHTYDFTFTSYTDRPKALNVTITGTLQVGLVATGTYTYSDADPEGATTFKWYRSNDASGTGKTEITGATAITYTPVDADDDKYLLFEVTPRASSGIINGLPTLSPVTGPVGPRDGFTYVFPKYCGDNQNMKVNGRIKCNSLLIHNWLLQQKGSAPDYVFDKGYELPTLEQIEQYIKANGHLPEVPAAKELETNGVDMIQINFILLKKIEEMTLHMIAQEKKMKEMEKKIAK
jgi:hypothetical protein